VIDDYIGVDFTPTLLERARKSTGQKCYLRQLGQANSLSGLGHFNAIACLATLQHIPGRINRLRLLSEMSRHLVEDGLIILSNWQFIDSERQRKKIVGWSDVGLDASDVEQNDYLLTWRREGFGIRYVALVHEKELETLLVEANLEVITHFRADGKEANLNLYTIARRP
jgi:SAM-dependent methyltransferase